MLDDVRFPHVRIPKFLNVTNFPELTPSILATYVAARSFAYLRSRSSERFARCWPAIRTIGEIFAQGDSVVKRNLSWLEAAGLIYRQRRFNQSSVITFVDFPERFQELRRQSGLEPAINDYEERLAELVEQARTGRAEEAQRRPTKNYHPGSESIPQIRHSGGRESPQVTPGGSASGLSGVRPRPIKNSGSEEQKNEAHDLNRFAAEELISSLRGALKNKRIETLPPEQREARLRELQRQVEILKAGEQVKKQE